MEKNEIKDRLFDVLNDTDNLLSKKEMQNLQKIVKEASYGPAGAGAEDGQFVRWVYFRLAEQVLQRLKGFRKLIFRYGKGFG